MGFPKGFFPGVFFFGSFCLQAISCGSKRKPHCKNRCIFWMHVFLVLPFFLGVPGIFDPLPCISSVCVFCFSDSMVFELSFA